MFCGNCGNRLEEEGRFCSECGCPVPQEVNQPEPEPVAVPEPAPEPVVVPEPEPEPEVMPEPEPVAVTEPEPVPEPEPAPIPQPIPTAPVMAPPAPVPEPMPIPKAPLMEEPAAATPTERPTKKKSPVGKILLVVFLLLLVVCGGGLYLNDGFATLPDQLTEAMERDVLEVPGVLGTAIVEGVVSIPENMTKLVSGEEAEVEESPQEPESSPAGGLSPNDRAEKPAEASQPGAPMVEAGVSTAVNLDIHLVDVDNFPEIKMYVTISDLMGNNVSTAALTDFELYEALEGGSTRQVSIDMLAQMQTSKQQNINLVVDTSLADSIASSDYLTKLLSLLATDSNTAVSVTAFDDYVYVPYTFTQDIASIAQDENGFYVGMNAPLYDAIYSALVQTYLQDGNGTVVVFTDGDDVGSNYSYADVVTLSQNTGIPVYVMAVGADCDIDTLYNLTTACSGALFQMESEAVEEIGYLYQAVYTGSQTEFVFQYTSPYQDELTTFRSITLTTTASGNLSGQAIKSYKPQVNVVEDFQIELTSSDYILPQSQTQELTVADLEGLSLAELRLARNEIYARYGRQFTDATLNQWFYSKDWYLSISPKYAPADFDSISPNPLSTLEQQNAEFILEYESYLLEEGMIFPMASTELLSAYDLSLSDATLELALEQLGTMPYSTVLEQNITMILEALAQADINY